MSQRLPYRRAPRQEVVPRHLAEQLVRERDALADQLRRSQGGQARFKRALQARDEERLNLLQTSQALERQVRALQARQTQAPVRSNRDHDERDRLTAQVRELRDALQRSQREAAELRQALEVARSERRATTAPAQRAVAEKVSADADHGEVARVKRLSADLANLRRRRDEDITRRVRQEKRQVLNELLEVRDSLAQALMASTDKGSAWHQGTVGVRQQFDESLRRLGVEALGVAGERFDAARHEAIGVVEDPGEPGRVLQVFRQGFAFNDGELVRPAQVVVSKEE